MRVSVTIRFYLLNCLVLSFVRNTHDHNVVFVVMYFACFHQFESEHIFRHSLSQNSVSSHPSRFRSYPALVPVKCGHVVSCINCTLLLYNYQSHCHWNKTAVFINCIGNLPDNIAAMARGHVDWLGLVQCAFYSFHLTFVVNRCVG